MNQNGCCLRGRDICSEKRPLRYAGGSRNDSSCNRQSRGSRALRIGTTCWESGWSATIRHVSSGDFSCRRRFMLRIV